MRWRTAIDQRLSNLIETIRAHQRTLNDHHRRIETQRAQLEELDNVVTVLVDRLDAFRLVDLSRAIGTLTDIVMLADRASLPASDLEPDS